MKLPIEPIPASGLTLAEFYDRLERHDWWHVMSDDPKERARWEENELALLAYAEGKPEYLFLLHDYSQHVICDKPKPARPEPNLALFN